MKYRIVEEYGLETLERYVQELIGTGWVPQGGVAINGTYGNVLYAQAMVKHEPGEGDE